MLLIKTGVGAFIIILLSLTFTMAQGCDAGGYMGSFSPDTNITFTETCPTCTFLNITIRNPESTIIISNEPMTLTGGVFNYTLDDSFTSILGTYFIDGHSNLDDPFKSCFDVSGARPIESSEATLYFILVFLAVLVFLVALYGAIALPFSNPRNPLGRIMDITWFKYAKVFLIVSTYLLFVWIMNLGLTITSTLVSLTQYAGFFDMIFTFFLRMIYPLLVLMFLFYMIMIWRDLGIVKLLERGINPR